MEFFYDTHGITWEGAAVCSIAIALFIIGAGKLTMEGIKKFIKWRKKRLLIKEIRELIPGMNPEERRKMFPNWKEN